MATNEQVTPAEQYLADGFYLADYPVLPKEIVNAAIAGMDEVRQGRFDRGRSHEGTNWKPGDDPHTLCKIEQPQFANQAIFDLVSHAELGALAAKASGANMVQAWWVQLLYKPPSPPGADTHTNIGWHQDRNYWAPWKEQSNLFTAWVALSDVGADCGPMIFLRGSNRWGYQEGLSDFFGQDLDGQQQAIEAQGQRWDEVPAQLPSGGISFHDRLTFHGSKANLSGRPRRSLAIHMRTEQSWPEAESHVFTSFLDKPELCPVIFGSL